MLDTPATPNGRPDQTPTPAPIMETPLEPGTIASIRALTNDISVVSIFACKVAKGTDEAVADVAQRLIHAADHEEGELMCESIERLADIRRRTAGFVEILDTAIVRLWKATGLDAEEDA
jgi:hypothetical protein